MSTICAMAANARISMTPSSNKSACLILSHSGSADVMPKYLARIELVSAFGDIGQGRGGYWEDNGYDWYGGI